jgi:hypothetical protein
MCLNGINISEARHLNIPHCKALPRLKVDDGVVKVAHFVLALREAQGVADHQIVVV